MSEEARLPRQAIPVKTIQALIAFSATLGIDPQLRELVNLRVSQINGCAFCMDMHSAALVQQGVPPRQLYALAGWREAHRLFDARERAALAWAEAVNAIPARSPSDDEFQEMKKHFNDTEIAQLTFAVGAIRTWNMMNVSMRTPVPETPYAVPE